MESATLLLALLAALLLAQNVWAQAGSIAQPVTISVQLTDQDNGAQLEQVRVELVLFPDEVMQITFTDGSGRATFNPVSSGTYLLRASLRDYQPVQLSIDTMKGQMSFFQPIQMRRVDPKSNLPAGSISARELSIPEGARKEFSQGISLLNEKKAPEESIQHFQNAIAVYPNYYEAYFLMGMAYLQTNAPDKALPALQKSIDLNPKFLDPYYPLSEVLMQRKQFDKVVSLMVTADQQDSKGWRWPYQLAMCYAKQGVWDKALSYGQTALTRPNPPSKVHLLMADIYSNSGDPAKAVAELEEFEKLDPKSPYVTRIEQVLPELRKQAAVRPANSPQP